MENEAISMQLFNRNIVKFVRKAIGLAGFRPSMILSIHNILSKQKKAIALRQKNADKGLQVPPMLILSVTSTCNLNCAGCYSHEQNFERKVPLTPDQLDTVLFDAAVLGDIIKQFEVMNIHVAIQFRAIFIN